MTTLEDLKYTHMTSLELKRKLENVRNDNLLTTSEKIAKKRALWSEFESKFSIKG